MHHFSYKNTEFYAEDVAISDLISQIGTPFYVYSTATLQRHFSVFSSAFSDVEHQVCYSIKANSNQAVLKTLADLGSGADVVSEGELKRALAVGISPRKIVFSGVGKTKREMAFALSADILCFNVESYPELLALNQVAVELGKKAPVALRINPDVDAQTHEKITTGKSDNKFGISYLDSREIYKKCLDLSGINPVGIDMHIGSQLQSLTPFEKACRVMAELIVDLKKEGVSLEHADLGGGIGVPYDQGTTPPLLPSDYAKMVKSVFSGLGVRLLFEPGRMIVGNAGVLVTQVLYVKDVPAKRFVIVDAAMNDLLRPTLYEAWHDVFPLLEEARGRKKVLSDIVGPICESGDYIAKGRLLPEVSSEEYLVIMTAGAYGAVLSNTYNSRLLIPEVLVNGSDYAVVRPRMTYDELLSRDQLAPWQV